MKKSHPDTEALATATEAAESALKKTATRIYVVSEVNGSGGEVEHLVRAVSQASAIRHVTLGRFEARAANTEDVARLISAGVTLQTAGEEA